MKKQAAYWCDGASAVQNHQPQKSHTIKTMHISRTIWPVLLLVLTGWGCRKDVDTFRPYNISVDDITAALRQVPATQTASVLVLQNTGADTLFVTPSGVRIFLDHLDQLFSNASGTVIPCSTCPNFRLEVIEVQQKGDLIARNTGTITANDQVLESGITLHLRASCNGEELQLTQGNLLKIQVPAEQPLFANRLFTCDATLDEPFPGWSGSNMSVNGVEWPLPGGSSFQLGYQIFTPSLQWICAGRMLEEVNGSYCLELPIGFSAQNTKAFMVFKSLQSVVPLQYHAADFRFCAPSVPQGFPVQLVTVSKLGNQFWLGVKDSETGGSNSLTLEPQKMTEQQVIDFIKDL